jgi:hypothetical protein
VAKIQHKWQVLQKHPKAKLVFKVGAGNGYRVEVEGRPLGKYQWSPVNAWAKADLQPLFE